jgi:hypothetical protein
LEKRDCHVFEEVFHAAADKAQGSAGKMKKLFKSPLRIIDVSVISLCLKKYGWAKYRKVKGAVKPRLSLDGDNLMPYDAYLSTGKVHDLHGMVELCGESGVIYVLDRGYVDCKSLYNIDLQGSTFVTRMKSNGAYKRVKNNPHEKGGAIISDVLMWSVRDSNGVTTIADGALTVGAGEPASVITVRAEQGARYGTAIVCVRENGGFPPDTGL